MKDGRHPTHKEKEENILVNYVSQRTKTQYFAELMLDGNNEFLLDHVNGVHIPGLVFAESYPNEAHDLNSYKKTLCLWTKQGLFEEIEQKCSKYRLQEVWIICSSPGDRSTQSLITQVKECGAVPVTIQSLAQIPERIAGRRIGVLFAPIPKNKELLSIKSSLIQIAGREGTVCVSS
ncbi:hypothetical protein C9I99_18420 [Photobacterium lutimaris]|uniref:A-factor biosynthesis hotdog domain-containing protein n=2 Tax=Photobacterium lutimaris TaxID=388278 RepID=A0A2T3IUV6_9GAMM|nr:hypothetical protein C9I99_18420 [Photobacterium lutimaris]